MSERDAVLALLNITPVPGRTMVQKLVYLLLEQEGESSSFVAHYYGPYSASVRQYVEDLVNEGLVSETVRESSRWEDSPFDVRQYRYELTDAGKEAAAHLPRQVQDHAARLVGIVKEEHAWSAPELSVAAKLHLIASTDPGAAKSEMPDLALQFGWRITPAQVTRGAHLVRTLGLDHVRG